MLGMEGTRAIAHTLSKFLREGDMVCLQGDVGVGKTAFAQELIRCGTGLRDLPVTSPTFTLKNTYEHLGLEYHHWDLYRLTDLADLDVLDKSGIRIIEWPERLGENVPEFAIWVDIADGDSPDERIFQIRTTDEALKTRIDDDYQTNRQD